MEMLLMCAGTLKVEEKHRLDGVKKAIRLKSSGFLREPLTDGKFAIFM
jgi:hypothetical protein